MTWGVWCVRSGGVTSDHAAWLREDGFPWTTETEAEATAKARETSLAAHETFAIAGRTNPLSYRALELDVTSVTRRQIFRSIKERRETDDGR